MAQFFQGGGVVSDQGQQLQAAAGQLAALAQQAQQINLAKRQQAQASYDAMLKDFLAKQMASGKSFQEYASGLGQAEYQQLEQMRMNLTGQGQSPLRQLLGLGTTPEAASQSAASVGDPRNWTPEQRLRAQLNEASLRGFTGQLPAQPQANAPQNTQAGMIRAPAQAPAPIEPTPPSQAPVPQGNLGTEFGKSLVSTPRKLSKEAETSLKRQQTNAKIDIDDLQMRLSQARTPQERAVLEKQIADKQVYLKNIEDTLTAPSTVQTSETRPVAEPTPTAPKNTFREYLRSKGFQGVSATGDSAKDAALVRNNPGQYQEYLKSGGVAATGRTPTTEKPNAMIEKKLDKQSADINTTLTEKAVRDEKTLQMPPKAGSSLGAGRKFYEQTVSKKIGNYLQMLADAPTDSVYGLAKEQEDWIKAQSSLMLEAYGMSDLATRKQQQEVLAAEERLLRLQMSARNAVDAGKVDAAMLKEMNGAFDSFVKLNDSINTGVRDAGLKGEEGRKKYLLQNPDLQAQYNAAVKNIENMTGIRATTINVMGATGAFAGIRRILDPLRIELGGQPGITGGQLTSSTADADAEALYRTLSQ